ncbi:tRNA threonylcarbamoyladenosine biosynthesis protein TsaB [Vibrio stylophorae]|uniref:tRNA threonylcarbamoyladenosine biosynthesis protein TsaB n=1 Tax=Vibrio stylophorae TaxID=659351 RepID=A0ABN8DRK2_9VIBR|nr:tRNA (adenosine(37)-N6)-threonylcarbamoyltransferase complex dimerization subunit type 1 TsaB [Vibrio stylophorae]CAH0533282.1 tRNA threonylcarbamoyladenosine biosynthesis protein TsaB [Vibrio stylophorae]
MTAKILAIDTATENCSVALMIGDQVIEQSLLAPREHTQKVLPMVDQTLAQAGLSLQQLDAIAFGRGPGSFTGVRIGIGIAQGLAFGADLPLIGISTLQAMAQATYRLHQAEHVLAAIDARMNEIYFGHYARQANGDWLIQGEELVLPPQDLSAALPTLAPNTLRVGTGWDAYAEQLQDVMAQSQACEVLYPQAQDMAMLAQYRWQAQDMVAAELAEPTYLRDKVTWKKLPGRE